MTRSSPLRIGIQMDPIAKISLAGDTSFALMETAQARGHLLFYYTPEQLYYREGRVRARMQPIRVDRHAEPFFELGPDQPIDLADDLDVVLMRQDPPFDMAYQTYAHLLEMVHPRTLVVNDPFWVRSSPEKILPLLFADLMPPTLVSRDKEAIDEFRAAHGDIVLKPLYGAAGGGVYRVSSEDANYRVILENFWALSREPIMAQAFVPAVTQGDKRIFLIDGQLAGGFNRVPAKGEIRSNLAAGGRAAAVDLSPADERICARIGPELRKRGLLFVGIDVIAGHLTEINVTSPTGARALMQFSGIDVCALAWDAIEKKYDARQM